MKRLFAHCFFTLCTLVISFIVSLAAPSPKAHASAPDIQWEQIKTPHFLIVFDSKHRTLGELYARYAEQAFTVTAPAFGVWPQRTIILIDDGTDIANGLATGVPYPMITTYPVLPTALDSISDYGNWGLELLTHEYTHILTFEPTTGFMRPLRWVFGSIVRPNVMLPRWYLEGLAVEMETRYSHFGRLRSANYLSIPRAMVEENKLRDEDISRINETSIPDWPGGIRPYLMGALLWNEMTRQGGDKTIGQLNLDYSRRIPFFINGPVETRLGRDYSTLLGEVYDRMEKQTRAQLERIRAAGEFKGQVLQQKGFFSHSPAVSPDGKKLVFIGRMHNVESLVFLVERESAQASFVKSTPKRLLDGTFISRAAWLPDSSGFIYDTVDTHERYYEYADLWRFDLASKKKTQLTHGMRTKEPALSPDGKTIVFVQNTPGSTQLAAVDASGNAYRLLYAPPIQTRIARPEFLSAGQIIFSEKRDDGSEVLKVLALDSTEPRAVLTAFKPAHFPRMTAEGLLFASDRSGVANLYLANSDLTDARAVSNTTTRLMTGEIDPVTRELLYGRLTASGPLLFVTPREGWAKIQEPPQVGAMVDYEWPAFQEPTLNTETTAEPYSPWPHLLPRYWMPYAYVFPGGSYFQASTATADPTGRHSYALTAAYDTQVEAPSFFAAYTNRTTRVPLTVAGQDIYEYIPGGGVRRRTSTASLTGKFFLPKLSDNWSGGLGLQYLTTDLQSDRLTRAGVSGSVAWSNASQKGMEISPESGGAFSLTQTQYLPDLGNIDYEQTDFRGAYYFSKWLPERHVLAFSTNVSVAPRLNRALLGRSTYGGSYQNNLQGGFIMRGYDSGTFLGRNLISATTEYRFPLAYMYRGFGTTPFFIQRVHGDVFVDAITLDGLWFDSTNRVYRRTNTGQYFSGTGVELKADTTLFYHLPVQFVLGLYYGLDGEANPGGLSTFFGFGY